jgi:hypothetical protein
VGVLQDRFRVSQRCACRLAGQHRNTQRRPVPLIDIEEQKLKQWIRELARRHVRWGRRLVYLRWSYPDSVDSDQFLAGVSVRVAMNCCS